MSKAALFAAAAVVALASFAPVAAHADTRAWAAAKAGLPAEAKIVLGIDLAAIQKTDLFAMAFPKLIAKIDASNMLDKIKVGCKVDPLAAIQSVVLASDADKKDGAIYVAITGFDQAKLAACIQAAASAGAEKAKVSAKRTGDITELTIGTDTFFFGWIGSDVLVIPAKAIDKAMLQKWTGGKGALAKTDVGRAIGKVNTGSALWGVGNITAELQPGATMKLGYGALSFAKGNVDADVHAVMTTAPQAVAMAKKANDELVDARGKAPAALAAMLKAISVAAARDEVIIRASVVEKDLASIVALGLASL